VECGVCLEEYSQTPDEMAQLAGTSFGVFAPGPHVENRSALVVEAIENAGMTCGQSYPNSISSAGDGVDTYI